jgi:hypothetical protein
MYKSIIRIYVHNILSGLVVCQQRKVTILDSEHCNKYIDFIIMCVFLLPVNTFWGRKNVFLKNGMFYRRKLDLVDTLEGQSKKFLKINFDYF